MSDTPIFDELAAKFGGLVIPYFADSATRALPPIEPVTQSIPVVPPLDAGPVTQTIPVVVDDISWADGLVQPSWNGLRPEDAALPQPPQDPSWRPSAIG